MQEYRSVLAKKRECRRDIVYKQAEDSESSSDAEWNVEAIKIINANSFKTNK